MAKTKNHEVSLSRRAKEDRRGNNDRRADEATGTVEKRVSERRKVPRRRQIDPTTCERDYSDDEIQFMHALDAYKRTSGRMFPTCSEILEVIRALGYVRTELPAAAAESNVDAATQSDSQITSAEVTATDSPAIQAEIIPSPDSADTSASENV